MKKIFLPHEKILSLSILFANSHRTMETMDTNRSMRIIIRISDRHPKEKFSLGEGKEYMIKIGKGDFQSLTVMINRPESLHFGLHSYQFPLFSAKLSRQNEEQYLTRLQSLS